MFAGKTVVCIGAGPSGVDIALDLSNSAHKVNVYYSTLTNISSSIRIVAFLCVNATASSVFRRDLFI